MNHHVTIIGIAGGTGSGKTTVVKKIAEALPPDFVSIVPLDSYYNDTTGMTDEARKAINFDHPDAFDWRLLIEQVNDLRQGKAIEQPTYSYILSNRLPETIHVEPKPVVIIEGIMVLFNKELRDMMEDTDTVAAVFKEMDVTDVEELLQKVMLYADLEGRSLEDGRD